MGSGRVEGQVLDAPDVRRVGDGAGSVGSSGSVTPTVVSPAKYAALVISTCATCNPTGCVVVSADGTPRCSSGAGRRAAARWRRPSSRRGQ